MAESTSSQSPKGRRVSIDLSAAAAAEVDRLRAVTDLSSADLFRHAFHLFRMYVEQRSRGKNLYFADPDDPDHKQVQIELPILVPTLKAEGIKKRVAKLDAPGG